MQFLIPRETQERVNMNIEQDRDPLYAENRKIYMHTKHTPHAFLGSTCTFIWKLIPRLYNHHKPNVMELWDINKILLFEY